MRLPLDVLIAFTANPEDYTARGKIITPLKDRIGAEIRTHYMQNRADALSITEQEAWVSRGGQVEVPRYVREVVKRSRSRRATSASRQAFGRQPAHADRRPRNVVSNAERRALANAESPVVPRVTDVYAALPSMTGKFELEYEGELKGADQVARDLVRTSRSRIAGGSSHCRGSASWPGCVRRRPACRCSGPSACLRITSRSYGERTSHRHRTGS